MKKKFFLCLGLIITANCLIFAADPAEGYWISVDEKTGAQTAGWQIYVERDGKLYGKIVSAPGVYASTIATTVKESYQGFPVAGRVNQMKVLGTPWLWGLTKKKDGEWERGKIVDPNDGKMYDGNVTFHARDGRRYQFDTLEMRGYLGLPAFGRSQLWRKATQAQASNVR